MIEMHDIMYHKIMNILENKPKEIQKQVKEHVLNMLLQMDKELQGVPDTIKKPDDIQKEPENVI